MLAITDTPSPTRGFVTMSRIVVSAVCSIGLLHYSYDWPIFDENFHPLTSSFDNRLCRYVVSTVRIFGYERLPEIDDGDYWNGQ